jgi:hypothetical protein
MYFYHVRNDLEIPLPQGEAPFSRAEAKTHDAALREASPSSYRADPGENRRIALLCYCLWGLIIVLGFRTHGQPEGRRIG